TGGRTGHYWLWDPCGTTVVSSLEDSSREYAEGQVLVLPLDFWHLLQVRNEASSRKLRAIGRDECSALFQAAAADRAPEQGTRHSGKDRPPNPLKHLLPAVKTLLPPAPERMAMGAARLIECAERGSVAFSTLCDKTKADSAKETHSATLVVYRESDLAATQ